MPRKNSSLPSALLFAVLLLASCSRKENANAPIAVKSGIIQLPDTTAFSPAWSKTNAIIVHFIGDPDNLHPSNGNSGQRNEINLYIHRYLLNNRQAGSEVQPELVKSLPEISADGLRFTYELKEGIQWDNGEQLTVADVLFTLKANICPLTNNPALKPYLMNIAYAYSDSLNQGRFTIVMRKPYSQNISCLTSFPIIQKSFHDQQNVLSSFSIQDLSSAEFRPGPELTRWAEEYNNDKYGRDPEFVNGLGPYRFSSWESGQSIVLEKKKNHWSDQKSSSGPDKIIYKINKDENSTLLDFKSQVFDVSANLSMSTFFQLYNDPAVRANYHLQLTPSFNYSYICFNERPEASSRPPFFSDQKVRRAVAHLISVERITQLLYKELSTQSKRMVSNVSPLKEEFDTTLAPLQHDPGLAKSLLADAGWSDTDKDGVLDKNINGRKTDFNVELYYLNTSVDWKDISSLIVSELEKAGISVSPVALELKVFQEKAKSHNFDLLLGSWGGSSLPEDFTQLWHTSSWYNNGANYSGFGNEQTDLLIDSIKSTLEPRHHMELSRKLQRIIYDDQPYVFLYSSLRRNIVHKRWGNVFLYPERPGIFVDEFRLLSTTAGIN